MTYSFSSYGEIRCFKIKRSKQLWTVFLISSNKALKYFKYNILSHHIKIKLSKLCKEFCKENFNIKLLFNSFRVKNYFPNKDPIPNDLKSFLVYKFTCASCSSSYIGETCCHFKTRIEEHIKKDNKSHIFKHLHSTTTCFDSYNSLCFKIIDKANSKFDLKTKEALYINWRLIKGIFKDLQKLLKNFSGTAIFTPFLFVIRLDLYLNNDEIFWIWLPSTVKSTSHSISSLLNHHKLPEVSQQLSLYSIKLYIGIVISICSASSVKVSLISVLHFVNGAQFLDTLFVLSLAPTTAIFAVTEIYASE